jgi:hypothetical protein
MSNDFWKDYEPEPVKPAPVTKDEALDLALEAAYLAGFNASGEGYNGEYGIDCPEENAIWKKDRDNALTAIKQARSAPVQEPDHGNELTIAYMSGLHDGKKKREWVGLTDEEVSQLIGGMPHGKMVRAIEAKLKEKNT